MAGAIAKAVAAIVIVFGALYYADKWWGTKPPPRPSETAALREQALAREIAEAKAEQQALQRSRKLAADLANLRGVPVSQPGQPGGASGAGAMNSPPAFVYVPGTTPKHLPWPSSMPPLVAPSKFDGWLRDIPVYAADYYQGLPFGANYVFHIRPVRTSEQITVLGDGFDHKKFIAPIPGGGMIPFRFKVMDVQSTHDDEAVEFTLEWTLQE